MAKVRYYALVASLPRLVHFEQAEYVPVTRKQLESRLRALAPDHLHQIHAASALLRWRNQPANRTAKDLAAHYGRVMAIVTEPALHEFVELVVGQRTAVAALRMRRRGETPQPGDTWGAGRWTRNIQAHWDDEDLGMGAVFPWLGQARQLVAAQDALGIERLLSEVAWSKLTEIEGRTAFGFERIIGFVFKWELVTRWLGFNAESAKTRFQELLAEVIRDHQQIFA